MKTLLSTFAVAATAVMFAPRSATADHGPRCEIVFGQLEEHQPGAAGCPTDHPGCYTGQIDGFRIHATTQFFAEGVVASPPQSPGWFNYSGVTTYTMDDGSITTRETGLATNFAIPDAEPAGSRASLSMEVITSGSGDLAGATGYLFVTGFNDPTNHVVSLVQGKICRP